MDQDIERLDIRDAAGVPLLSAEQCWECNVCDFTDVTREAQPHSHLHPCAGMGGLMTPMVPAGTKAKVLKVIREDYMGGDVVQYDDERHPVSHVVVERDDGNDVAALAPCVVTSAREEP